eukprot:593395-Pyramimonas_sp.AAC.1
MHGNVTQGEKSFSFSRRALTSCLHLHHRGRVPCPVPERRVGCHYVQKQHHLQPHLCRGPGTHAQLRITVTRARRGHETLNK